jgi:hypothetical protein
MNSFLQLLDDLNIQPVKPNRRDASSYPTLVQSAYSTNDNQFNNPSDDVSQDLNDKIISKINDQFEIERKGYLEIKSILKAPTNNDADNDVVYMISVSNFLFSLSSAGIKHFKRVVYAVGSGSDSCYKRRASSIRGMLEDNGRELVQHISLT